MQRVRSAAALGKVQFEQKVPSPEGTSQDRRNGRHGEEDLPDPTKASDEHPRGHKGLNKRVRFIAVWSYHRMGSSRFQGIAALLAVFALVGLLVRHHYADSAQSEQKQYVVYIDGGSSGTRVHVFQYKMRQWPAYVKLSLPERTFSVEPGLSSYAGRPQQAAESLKPLLDFALRHVPEPLWRFTPVFLLATAGLRLLSAQDAQDILNTCSAMLTEESQLMHTREWARIISGDSEGVYAWTAVNYVKGALEDACLHHYHSRKGVLPPQVFNGVLELGGASFQITFMPVIDESELTVNSSAVPLPGVDRHVFTHSYLGLGMDSAMRAAADVLVAQHKDRTMQAKTRKQVAAAATLWDPCLPGGYESEDGRKGNASLAGCMELVQNILPPRVCQPAGKAHHKARHVSGQHHPSHNTGRAALLSGTDGQGDEEGGRQVIRQTGAHDVVHPPQTVAPSGSSVRCTFAGVDVPPVSGIRFVALENFFWTARALGLGPASTLADVRDAGIAHCSLPWSELHMRFAGTVPTPFITRYCFGAAYVYLLLHDRLGIPEHEHVLEFTNTIKRRKRRRQQHAATVDPRWSTLDGGDGDPGGRQLNGLGSSTGEIEVGLNWVVGAALVHAMNARRQGTLEYFRPGARERFEDIDEMHLGRHYTTPKWELVMWVPAVLGAVLLVMYGWRVWLRLFMQTANRSDFRRRTTSTGNMRRVSSSSRQFQSEAGRQSGSGAVEDASPFRTSRPGVTFSVVVDASPSPRYDPS